MSLPRTSIAAIALLWATTNVLGAEEHRAPVGDAEPLPVLDVGGPSAAVTALAFAPDGQTLYSAGYDKVVRVWRRDVATAAFRPDAQATVRVPIGPGRDGVINVLAVSPDGEWLAASG